MLLDSGRPQLCGLPLAAAVLTKPQGLILLPAILFELIRRKDIRLFIKTALYGLVGFIIIILPFAVNHEPSWIFNLYFNTAEGYQYASLNAFNFFSLAGANLTPDSETFLFFNYKTWAFIFIIGIMFYAALLHFRGKS